MTNKAKIQVSIQTLISILILMTLFVASAHAKSCHNSEQDTSQFSQKLVNAHDISSTGVAVEASAVQYESYQCCKRICNSFCNSHRTHNNSFLGSRAFEKKYSVDNLITKDYFDSELEYTHNNPKRQDYYRNSHFTFPSTLQTTLKYHVLRI